MQGHRMRYREALTQWGPLGVHGVGENTRGTHDHWARDHAGHRCSHPMEVDSPEDCLAHALVNSLRKHLHLLPRDGVTDQQALGYPAKRVDAK